LRASILLHVAVWSSVMLAAPAQQKAKRHDAAAWVPTEEGSNWTYRRVTTDLAVQGTPGEARIGRGLFGTYRRADGSRWHLVAVHDGGTSAGWEHWNTEGPGLLVQTTPTPLASGDAATQCVLAGPVGAVNRWEWEVEERSVTVVHRATLVAFDEAVSVPAGPFRAVHVRVEEFGDEREPGATEDSWFARDVGLVRLERSTKKTRELTELLAFARGRDQTQERLATLQMLAPPAWLWTKHGAATIRWLDQDAGSVAFGGRFAVIGDGAALQVAFVRPGACVPLPAEGVQPWQEISRGTLRRELDVIAMTAARVHGARLQPGTAAIENEGRGRATLRVTLPDRERSFEILATAKLRRATVEVEVHEQTTKR
jgi:hypothetical protein